MLNVQWTHNFVYCTRALYKIFRLLYIQLVRKQNTQNSL